MPAYFSIDVELPITPNAVKHFFLAFENSGAEFSGGFWDASNASYDDLIQWSQRYIEGKEKWFDKKRGRSIVKQFLFNYDDFTECRVYVWPCTNDNNFRIHVILPEEDFYEYKNNDGSLSCRKKRDRMDSIKELAICIWEKSNAITIQTAWECSDIPPPYQEILKGTPPQVEPFCIIPAEAYRDKWKMSYVPIARNGRLIENDKNWFYN